MGFQLVSGGSRGIQGSSVEFMVSICGSQVVLGEVLRLFSGSKGAAGGFRGVQMKSKGVSGCVV